mmetsp:Transcript_20208/g.48575  ORF Transcript_20208/g.48575 Transcript_20208/m.48575 type:complete len:81 (+) Transcript_20208:3087-3329(+)
MGIVLMMSLFYQKISLMHDFDETFLVIGCLIHLIVVCGPGPIIAQVVSQGGGNRRQLYVPSVPCLALPTLSYPFLNFVRK